jgi:hypothetical protein
VRPLVIAILVIALAPPVTAAREFRARARHFRCLLDGVKPEGRDFFVFHRSRRSLRKALAIARGEHPGRPYPIGTIVQLVPFEAMVKRGGRFNPEGEGWEFFQLAIDAEGRTEILARGRDEVVNAAGSCQGCHLRVAGGADLVCEAAVGRGTLFSPELIEAFQQADRRCR